MSARKVAKSPKRAAGRTAPGSAVVSAPHSLPHQVMAATVDLVVRHAMQDIHRAIFEVGEKMDKALEAAGNLDKNTGRLNSALGDFRDKTVEPIKEELAYLRYNQGARTEQNIGSMEKLVHHLQSQLNFVLQMRGVDPHAKDAAGESVLDRLGVAPEPSSVELEAQVQELSRLRAENAELRKGLELDGLLPALGTKDGDTWVDPFGRHWVLQRIKSVSEMNG